MQAGNKIVAGNLMRIVQLQTALGICSKYPSVFCFYPTFGRIGRIIAGIIFHGIFCAFQPGVSLCFSCFCILFHQKKHKRVISRCILMMIGRRCAAINCHCMACGIQQITLWGFCFHNIVISRRESIQSPVTAGICRNHSGHIRRTRLVNRILCTLQTVTGVPICQARH